MSKKRKNILKGRRRRSSKSSVERKEVSISELEAIVERAAKEPLSEQECLTLQDTFETLAFITQELEKKRVSIKRLKEILFGATTEKLKNIIDKASGQDNESDSPNNGQNKENKENEKCKGHGRNGADDYTGAEKIEISHETLKPGDKCSNCKKGTVYDTGRPKKIVRVTGQAPVNATVYKLQNLRCNLCGKSFTAKAPKQAEGKKYDAESVSMIAVLKYGSGLPFNRLERLEGNMGIPLPASTQWDALNKNKAAFIGVYEELIRIAAQGKVVHNDDTGMKVLSLPPLDDGDDTAGDKRKNSERNGVFTSGVISIIEGYRIALFFTGHKHAGENLGDVLQHRATGLPLPIQMCDALSRNMSEDFKAIVANCLSHGRRKFVEVIKIFPSQCLHVLELIGKVYKNDEVTRQRKLSDDDRLVFHQTYSKPLMDDLKKWLTEQLDNKEVEPNSSLGQAICYMLDHWEKLTLFLRQPGAPLDNNICERALKKAILHRKNAYFYKTANGAMVGDMFMSFIHTCELNKVNPFDYLTELQKNAEVTASSPADWMPWNYKKTLAMVKVSDKD